MQRASPEVQSSAPASSVCPAFSETVISLPWITSDTGVLAVDSGQARAAIASASSKYFSSAVGAMLSTAPTLSNPAPMSSGGSDPNSAISMPNRSRMVLAYSVRLSRRGGPLLGTMIRSAPAIALRSACTPRARSCEFGMCSASGGGISLSASRRNAFRSSERSAALECDAFSASSVSCRLNFPFGLTP